MAKKKDKLPPLQQRFVDEYPKDWHETNAAIRAGYSPKTAASQASRLLKNVKIKKAIMAVREDISKTAKIDAAWLLRILADDVQADVSELFDDEKRLKHPKDWPPAFRKGLVSGLDVTALFDSDVHGNKEQVGVVTKIKLADRTKLKELIGKHTDIGAFIEKLKVEAEIGFKGIKVKFV